MVPITRFKVVSITSARDLVIVIAPSVAIPFIAIVVVPSVVISVICLREGRSAANWLPQRNVCQKFAVRLWLGHEKVFGIQHIGSCYLSKSHCAESNHFLDSNCHRRCCNCQVRLKCPVWFDWRSIRNQWSQDKTPVGRLGCCGRWIGQNILAQ